MSGYNEVNLLLKMKRLTPFDEVTVIGNKMAEGNPGALEFVAIMLRNSKIHELIACDNLGLYGGKLYMFWNDCCQRDFDKVCRVLEQYMDNRITKNFILGHLYGYYGENINL